MAPELKKKKKKLHYVDQLVANFVCLLYDAVQVVYCGFRSCFQWKQPPAAGERVHNMSEAAVKKQITFLKIKIIINVDLCYFMVKSYARFQNLQAFTLFIHKNIYCFPLSCIILKNTKKRQ